MWSPRNRFRRARHICAGVVVAAVAVWGQAPSSTGASPSSAAGGEGEVALQGFYMGGNSQPFVNTTGTAFRFQQFLPGVGFFSGNLEGYGSQNRFQSGLNFLELRDAPWMGHHWTLDAGDFGVAGTLVERPFNNIFTPEIDARGVKVQAVHGETQYTFFLGEETLTAGTRVSYRIQTPQKVMGGSAVRRVASHLLIGARVMQFATSQQAMLENPYLFPPGRAAGLVRTLAVQALYTPTTRLKIYAEAAKPFAAGSGKVTSILAGAAWESKVFSWKANYASQGTLYFPLAGYFSGDRQGPYAEARFHPSKRVEFYGSASRYRNNLEHDESLPSLNSLSASGGMSATLSGNLSASASISLVRFTEAGGGVDAIASNNRQLNLTLARTVGRHTIHVDAREIRMDMTTSLQRQRSWEAGDTYQRRHFSVGGTVRYQQAAGAASVGSLFFRGTAQVNAGRLSAYGNFELGNDLANQTVFATEAYHTSVAGVGLRLGRNWNMQAEAFRNGLNLTINPENIFLLENGGALAGMSPTAQILSAMSQWSLYFRLTKQFHWGAGLPTERGERLTASAAPLMGEVQGMVLVKALDSAGGGAGITVSLDGGRTEVTGPNGDFRFHDVPEGAHIVALSLAALPADYDPGTVANTTVTVRPRRAIRADLEVTPLTSISGPVSGPAGAALDGIVIRLAPGGRYTTTAADGSFTFYNLREGDFELILDQTTLPENGELRSPASLFAKVRLATPVARLEYRIEIRAAAQKPIRKVLDKK